MNAQVSIEHTPAVGVQFHEFANVFPMLQGAALDAMRADIRENGVREPIVFLDGAILDGRNRYMCARDLGLEYPRREFGSDPSDGTDPLAFVISLNLTRRHLSESQRASAAARLANMRRGRPSEKSANLRNNQVSTADAASMLGVGTRSVESARKVHARGAPELIEAVDRGAVPVSVAADAADLPQETQEAILAREDAKAVREGLKEAIAETRKKPSRKNPLYKPDPASDAVIAFTGNCQRIAETPNIEALAAFDGFDGFRQQMMEQARAAAATLSAFLKVAGEYDAEE